MKVGYDERSYEIIARYANLGDGTTYAGQICPACEGGATKEGSLSVSRRGDLLLWCCHRASCGYKGSNGTSPNSESAGQSRSGRGEIDIATYPLNAATGKLLAAKFGVPTKSLELAGLRWTGDHDGRYGKRVCFPVFGPDSRKRGENYRSYQGQQPKSLLSLNPDGIGCCWYRWKRASKILVIVEDQMSAIKIAPYYDALALLGTNLSQAKADELVENNDYDHIYICLDPDATYDAIKMQLAWRDWIKNMRVMGIEKDIKDMNEVEFDSFMLRLI